MKILNMKKLATTSLLCMGLLGANQASAALVAFSVDGEITQATASNILGLSIGDTVTASGVYDDSTLVASLSEPTTTTYVDFTLASNNITISMGSMNYNAANGNAAYNEMFFFNNVFDGINYEAADALFDSWGILGDSANSGFDAWDFLGYDLDGTTPLYNSVVSGNWLVNTFQVTPVPVPAAVWLFASGALFLGGISRRRQQKTV